MEIEIRNCSFKSSCTNQWGNLGKTADPKIRYCDECEENVHYVHTDEELRLAIEADKCVALVVPYTSHSENFIGRVTYIE